MILPHLGVFIAPAYLAAVFEMTQSACAASQVATSLL
jgi:hypothetical protein